MFPFSNPRVISKKKFKTNQTAKNPKQSKKHFTQAWKGMAELCGVWKKEESAEKH